MKNFILLVVASILFVSMNGQNTGTELLKQIHTKYYEAPCKAYTFSQKNIHYGEDTITGRSEWHEAVEFPDKFVIHFKDKKSGNFVLFRNDSVYNYKAGKQIKSRQDTNTLLLLLGGMFYRPFNEVLHRMTTAGYKTEILSSSTWKKKPVFIIGAQPSDTSSNQIWVDKNNLRVLRIIEKMNEKDMMDMRFEAHQKWCNGYVETKVSFRRNGKLEQEEEYFDIKQVKEFPAVLTNENSR